MLQKWKLLKLQLVRYKKLGGNETLYCGNTADKYSAL